MLDLEPHVSFVTVGVSSFQQFDPEKWGQSQWNFLSYLEAEVDLAMLSTPYFDRC